MDFLLSDSPVFTWVILPLLIFLARIADQSVGTLRVVFISKGFKYLAPLLGFFESIIWLTAVSQILKHLDNVVCFLAYGAGFGMGNYVGLLIEEKLSLGTVIFRIFPRTDPEKLIAFLRESNYGLTIMDAQGGRGPVKIIFSIVRRQDIKEFVEIINRYDPTSFYTIEDVREVREGVFNSGQSGPFKRLFTGKKSR